MGPMSTRRAFVVLVFAAACAGGTSNLAEEQQGDLDALYRAAASAEPDAIPSADLLRAMCGYMGALQEDVKDDLSTGLPGIDAGPPTAAHQGHSYEVTSPSSFVELHMSRNFGSKVERLAIQTSEPHQALLVRFRARFGEPTKHDSHHTSWSVAGFTILLWPSSDPGYNAQFACQQT
jgi:hypothetical protein